MSCSLRVRRAEPTDWRALQRFPLSTSGAIISPALLAIADVQSALAPAGEQAARTASAWWMFFYVLISIFGLVAVVIFLALLRRPAPSTSAAEMVSLIPEEHSERRITTVVVGAVVATVVILFCLLIYDAIGASKMNALANEPDPIVVKVTGHQWWWEIQYVNENEPSKDLTTANELHVPIDRPVKLELQSNDVIHSFWVPNVAGKKDLIPGHPTETWLKADRPGDFRGQCAEFCGHQHAHMRLTFVAERPEAFESWIESQRADAPPPPTESAQRGQQVFLSAQCMMCHTISGTNSRSSVGPDLTHIATRPTLAAGSVPNTRGYLAGWILNPQNIKPGVRMPPNQFSSDDLNALLDYLESLK